ncbi:hypothetical protein GCM10020000_47470 [Streptomyces olivoverticillatus]
MPDGEAVGPAFAMAYEALDEDGARTFRALGVHPTTDMADELVEALAGGGADGRRVRRALLEAHLLEPASRGRCRMNGLIHAYARELARREPDARAATEDFLADWYLRRAAAAELLLSPRWHHGAVFARPELLSGVFDSREQALDAMERDRENVAVVIERACAAGRYDTVCQLVEALHGFFFRHKHHALWIEACRSAVEAAGHLQGTLAPARMHYELAFALIDRGSPRTWRRRRATTAGRSPSPGRPPTPVRSPRPWKASGRWRPGRGGRWRPSTVSARRCGRWGTRIIRGAGSCWSTTRGRPPVPPGSTRRPPASCSPRHAASPPCPCRTATTRPRACCVTAGPASPPTAPTRRCPAWRRRWGSSPGSTPPKDEADAYLARGDAHAADGRAERARADWESALGLFRRLGSIEVGQAARRLAGPAQGQE